MSTRAERAEAARSFFRKYGGWVRKKYAAIADLPSTAAIVEEPVDDFLDAMARYVDRGASAVEVDVARKRVSAAYREAKKAAASRKGIRSVRKIRKRRKIRTPRDPRDREEE